ncbi:MAG: carbohydrate ABC transporter permease [Roseburia sp.]|nr:carbohydrate ABC transporter permease [Anaeroplasma bactoclasticum]MCM1196229.1 carbohydrate ABC transporter permease [Roseburia sp.]MCM1556051.1 carbohydrate ABC transporter permease [Anaeroplasma bactoclasticum]
MENNLQQTTFDSVEKVQATIQRQKVLKILAKVFIYIFLILVAITTLFPFYWMINTSLKSMDEYLRISPTWFPESMAWDNYKAAFEADYFARNMINTLIVALTSTLLSMIIIILAAFAFARLEFKGKNLMFTILLATMMVPGELFTISNFATVTTLKWTNSYTVLIVPFLVSIFYVYLLRNAFKQIPDSLYYAAKVDGTSDLKYLLKVMIPLASPTITSIVILKIMGAWNSYIWPRLVNQEKNFQLISNWLTGGFNIEDGQYKGLTNFPMKMAGVFLVSLPLIIIFIFFRKYIMKGVSKSGIKG